MKGVILFTILFVVLIAAKQHILVDKETGEEYVITPHGIRSPQCVLEVPHNSTVTEVDGGARLSIKMPVSDFSEETVTKIMEVPQECHKDVQRIRQTLLERAKRIQQTNATAAPFPLNGWLDYTGWYPPVSESHLEKFTSTYTTPDNPQNPSAVLFYFIGMQDNDSPAVNIIQPVLTWGNGMEEWYVESWACCPSNITVHSPALTGLGAGKQMNGLVERISFDVWRIDSEFQGKHTTLNAQVGSMNYNWADVTLEVYNVNSCSNLARGTFTASDLALFDQQNKRLSPSWQYTSPTACNGRIRSVNDNTITIVHN